jgi:hypothetical protein
VRCPFAEGHAAAPALRLPAAPQGPALLSTAPAAASQGGDGTVRAINTFALRTGAGRGGGAALQILDFFDMRGDDFMTTPDANRWHAHEFVQDILGRLRAAMAAGALDAGRTL